MTQQSALLSPLREDIKLLPGARLHDGSPTWTLHDPVKHSFFKIGWLEFEILCRWNLGDAQKIFTQIKKQTTLQLNINQIEMVNRFLNANHLLQQHNSDELSSLYARNKNKKLIPFLLQNYLYLKIPLCRPDRFLSKTLPFTAFVVSPLFWLTLTFIGIFGIYLTTRQWDSFQNTFLYFFTIYGFLYFAISLSLVKILHELGHAYTAKRFGVRLPTMGIAFILFWPVLYTDTSEAWKLTCRRHRFLIAASGVLTELAIAVLATFAWNFIPAGPIKSVAFILATTTWLTTLAINLNPFMRFDGYYLLSDLLDTPNLQPRSFALGRWQLRRLLLGLKEPCPENLTKNHKRIMLAYCYSTWIYRIFLFTGIALMVYHVTFKVLGIILMAVEIIWFIGKPVFSEINHWWQKRAELNLNGNIIISFGFLACILFLCLKPWPVHVEMPAVYKSASYSRIFPPFSAQLDEIHINIGDSVKKGDLLFTLKSPDLDFKESQAAIEVDILKTKLQKINFYEEKSDTIKIVEQQLIEGLSTLNGYRNQQKRLQVKAMVQGTVFEFDESLTPGRWLRDKEMMAMIVDTSKMSIEGFIHENDYAEIETGQTGQFYPDQTEIKPFSCLITNKESYGVSTFESPYFASIFGGPIPIQVQNQKMVSPENYYRVILSANTAPQTQYILRGAVRLTGSPRNFIDRAWPHIASVFIRESGF